MHTKFPVNMPELEETGLAILARLAIKAGMWNGCIGCSNLGWLDVQIVQMVTGQGLY